MTVTTTSLTRAAGISAAVAGLLFIAVQINHPPMDVSSVTTTEWVVRFTAKIVMAAAALAGITGMYLRQVRQTGILGLVGYLVFGVGYLVMLGIEFAGAYVLPSLAHTAPGYVNDVLAAGAGGTVTGDIGLMQPAFSSPASDTWRAVSSSASRCSAHASWPAGLPGSSSSVPSPRLRFPCCRTRSRGRSRSRPASP